MLKFPQSGEGAKFEPPSDGGAFALISNSHLWPPPLSLGRKLYTGIKEKKIYANVNGFPFHAASDRTTLDGVIFDCVATKTMKIIPQ